MLRSVSKLLDCLFKRKCVYAHHNKDAESPNELKEIFDKALEQTETVRIVANTKQAEAIDFRQWTKQKLL